MPTKIQKHPDYLEEEELHYAPEVYFCVVYNHGEPESLVSILYHFRFMTGSTPDSIEFYRVPKWVYDMHDAFETYPIRSIDYYFRFS